MEPTMILGLLFAVGGGGALVYGIFQILKLRAFMEGSQKVVATVTSVTVSTSTDSEGETTTTYRPTVRFETLDGVEHSAQTYHASSNYDYDVGAKVTVLFKPGEDKVRIPGVMNQWLPPAILIVLGCAFGVVGLKVAFF
ncbi:MAG: DUF3592 domain-containing protein [Pseudomonadota bacterium]